MYTLTLTHADRAAFDWVGGRYYTGDAVASILQDCIPPMVSDHTEWDGNYPITFEIPEYRAWEIAELSESEDGLWPLFNRALRTKMVDFVNRIV